MIVRLWDFDGVLFKNPNHNYDVNYLTLDKITPKKILIMKGIQFSRKHVNILFTGRGSFNRKKILFLLKQKGYDFNGFMFWKKNKEDYPNYNSNITIKEFYNDYYNWKKEMITIYINTFKKIVVIDDDKNVVKIANDLGAEGRLINIHKEKF